jgi:hypothetical protein
MVGLLYKLGQMSTIKAIILNQVCLFYYVRIGLVGPIRPIWSPWLETTFHLTTVRTTGTDVMIF